MELNETISIPQELIEALQKALEPVFSGTDNDIVITLPHPNRPRKIVINYLPSNE